MVHVWLAAALAIALSLGVSHPSQGLHTGHGVTSQDCTGTSGCNTGGYSGGGPVG